MLPHARCGSIERPWEPGNPAAGTVTVGFAFVPARDRSKPALGTVVPHEGGPGYSTTGTATSYAEMYGPLLDRRNLLLVDQRGTGRSEPIDCPALQDLKRDYATAAAACGAALGRPGRRLHDRAVGRRPGRAGRWLGLGPVDVYGDSYGTFFAQVYAGRHPGRSAAWCSTAPTRRTARTPGTPPRDRRCGPFAVVCQRTPACRDAGRPFLPTLEKVLAVVRTKPWRGTAYDADGRRMRVTVDGAGLAAVAFGATYTPAFYRELTAALRSGLSGDRRPLLRLVAEATGGDTDAGPVKDYSEGLDAAVACHDYPQLYDMTAPPVVPASSSTPPRSTPARCPTPRQPGSAPTGRSPSTSTPTPTGRCSTGARSGRRRPRATRPVHRCRRAATTPTCPSWCSAASSTRSRPRRRADLVVDQFPNARHVMVANSFHVTAVGDTDDCAVRIVRSFVASPAASIRTGAALRPGRAGPGRGPLPGRAVDPG